tara:strand:- start:4843 stop:5268 length:426 start_codon:yes stop_codon:yes gene_type:complete
MATTTDTTTTLTDVEYSRWFLALKMFNEEFNTEFLSSVASAEDPSEKQLVGLSKCVTGLKIPDKLKKYDLTDHSVFFADEIDFSDPKSSELLLCSESGASIESDEMLIFNDVTKRFISVSAFKKLRFVKKPTKKRMVLSKL